MKCLMKHSMLDDIDDLDDDLDVEMSEMNDDVNIEEAKIMKSNKSKEKETKRKFQLLLISYVRLQKPI